MYLKVVYDEKTKKLAFKDHYHNFVELRAELAKLTGYPLDEIVISGSDSQGRSKAIRNSQDLQFVLNENYNHTFVEIVVTRSKDIHHELEESNQNFLNNSETFFNNVTSGISVNYSSNPSILERMEIFNSLKPNQENSSVPQNVKTIESEVQILPIQFLKKEPEAYR